MRCACPEVAQLHHGATPGQRSKTFQRDRNVWRLLLAGMQPIMVASRKSPRPRSRGYMGTDKEIVKVYYDGASSEALAALNRS